MREAEKILHILRPRQKTLNNGYCYNGIHEPIRISFPIIKNRKYLGSVNLEAIGSYHIPTKFDIITRMYKGVSFYLTPDGMVYIEENFYRRKDSLGNYVGLTKSTVKLVGKDGKIEKTPQDKDDPPKLDTLTYTPIRPNSPNYK